MHSRQKLVAAEDDIHDHAAERSMTRFVAGLLLAFMIPAAPAFAQQSVFLVRHAERADGGAGATTMNVDPDLSAIGKARAESLATILKDARIGAIFVTQFKRTRQTAEPLAKLLGVEPVIVTATDSATLAEKIKATRGNVLVVGHSNTVGPAVAALGVSDPIKIADDEYDNLFVVVRGEPPVLVRLHFR